MKPLTDFPRAECRRLKGVFLDIDDTLTTDGRLTAAAYGAMERLQKGGLRVIPITGRPAGWCDHIARMWPVDGVVGENGAFYFRYLRDENRMDRHFAQDKKERTLNNQRLIALAERILSEVPGAAISADQAYRQTDMAIDFCEDVAKLPFDQVSKIVEIFEDSGAMAKVSTIHVNGWFGDYDKLTMTKILMNRSFGVDLETLRTDYIFVGDSPNDEPMFEFFPNSVGVANVRDFAGVLKSEPKFVTESAAGSGFVEVASTILESRRKS